MFDLKHELALFKKMNGQIVLCGPTWWVFDEAAQLCSPNMEAVFVENGLGCIPVRLY